MADIHPPPGPPPGDNSFNLQASTEDLSAMCAAAPEQADAAPGMPSHGMGDQYA